MLRLGFLFDNEVGIDIKQGFNGSLNQFPEVKISDMLIKVGERADCN